MMPLLLRARSKRRRQPRRSSVVLKPEDFDDVRYRVEAVRVQDQELHDDDDDASRSELLATAFVLGVALLAMGGLVAMGFLAADALTLTHEAARSLLPLLLVPGSWLLVLHLWEHWASWPSPAVATG